MNELLDNPILLSVAIVALFGLVLSLVLLFVLYRYRSRQAELLEGSDLGKLDDIVAKNKKQIANHNKNLKELGEILSELVENNRLNIQKIGIVRYNPFEDTGSNMSFALALLDGHGNGVVISSLHGREGTRIYAKPIFESESKHQLTEEERSAILMAQKSYKQ
jgi:hypothetical protein